jgi:hypothetical protein
MKNEGDEHVHRMLKGKGGGKWVQFSIGHQLLESTKECVGS